MNPIITPDAAKMVSTVLRARLVPNLTGSPGIGKSDIIREVADELNLKVIDFRLSQSDPTDLNGFPTLNEDRTRSHYAPPTNIPLEGDIIPYKKVVAGEKPEQYNGWLLFFDEMNSAPLSVQAASYKIILDRLVGDTPLHKSVAMVCAGNLATDKAIVNRQSTAMQSRLVHFNLEVDVPAWIKWARKNKIDHRIIAFIQFREELLHKFDANHDDNTFPCPRTWHFASNLVKGMSIISIDDLPLLIGTVGEGAAREVFAFVEIYAALPTFDMMVNNPKGIKIPVDADGIVEDPGIIYAMTALIGSKADDKTMTPLMELIERFPLEFQVITLQNAIAKDVKLKALPVVRAWMAANASELIDE